MGVSLHTGGSIPASEHKKRLRQQSDGPPTSYNLFQRLHTRKGHPYQWISQKSEGIAGEYKRRLDERDSQTTGERSNHQSDNNIYLDVVGGVSKKGRIYDLGAEAGTLIPSSSTYDSEHCSASELETMRTTIVALTSELQQKKNDVNEMRDKLQQQEGKIQQQEGKMQHQQGMLDDQKGMIYHQHEMINLIIQRLDIDPRLSQPITGLDIDEDELDEGI